MVNWKCFEILVIAATVRGGTGLWAAAWDISTTERQKRNDPSSALLLLKRRESSMMHFFQEQFGGCFRSSVTEEANELLQPQHWKKRHFHCI